MSSIIPWVSFDALQQEILEQPEHVPAPLLRPHRLRVAQLHLEQLRGPQHGGQLVPRLEELAAGEDLGQQAAVRPHVRRGAGGRGLATIYFLIH